MFDLCGVAPDSLWRAVQFGAPGVLVDGDVIGTTPMHFTIAHRALKVSIPSGDLLRIFSRPRQADVIVV